MCTRCRHWELVFTLTLRCFGIIICECDYNFMSDFVNSKKCSDIVIMIVTITMVQVKYNMRTVQGHCLLVGFFLLWPGRSFCGLFLSIFLLAVLVFPCVLFRFVQCVVHRVGGFGG